MSLKDQLKALRVRKGESLQDLADAVGSSKPYIWELEQGRATNPSLDFLVKLAAHFKVPVAHLIGEDQSEALIFGREFKGATESDKKLIIEMAERLLKGRDDG